jgi:hypothetical protein
VRPGQLTTRPPWHDGGKQRTDHLVQVAAGQRAAADPPQVQLVRRARVLPVDDVAPVGHARADEQDVIGEIVGQHTQPRRHERGRVGAQHAPVIDVPGVARVPGDVGRVIPEVIVVVGDGDNPRPAAPADLGAGAPSGRQRGHGRVDDQLDRVVAVGRIGQVGYREVALELSRAEHGMMGLGRHVTS